jgi:hypothetical protein
MGMSRLAVTLRITLRAALWLWALPLTACGLPLWLGLRIFKPKKALAQLSRVKCAPVFIAYGAFAAWLLKHHPYGEMDAMAIGCCIFARDAQALQRTMVHELVHVEQAMRWGVLFPLAYILCSAWAKASGRCPYADNYFEQQANSNVYLYCNNDVH